MADFRWETAELEDRIYGYQLRKLIDDLEFDADPDNEMDNREEAAAMLAEVNAFVQEIRDNQDNDEIESWTLVRFSDAQNAAMEWAEETAFSGWKRPSPPYGLDKEVDPRTVWPFDHIDWEGAARDHFMYNGQVELRGITYYVT